MATLSSKQIAAALPVVKKWTHQPTAIQRTYEFKDFPAAIQFVDQVAVLAEAAEHHPDIDIRWNRVTLALTTHDQGGLTKKDFDLARKFDALAR